MGECIWEDFMEEVTSGLNLEEGMEVYLLGRQNDYYKNYLLGPGI